MPNKQPDPSHPYTLASRTSRSANQNLPKSMAAPSHGLTADRKHGHTTSCIVYLADSANFVGVTSNKLCNGLTGSCFESPNDTIHVTVSNNSGYKILMRLNPQITIKWRQLLISLRSLSPPRRHLESKLLKLNV